MSGVGEFAARTPATRDRYVDFLRAFSILAVVVGHWLAAVVYWRNGVIGTTNAIPVTGWAWLVTWILQVIPLFFFVGGFSNLTSYRSHRRRGASTGDWIRTRLARLARPSAAFIAVWVMAQMVLHAGRVGSQTAPFLRGVKPPGATLPFGPLWFLAAYAVMILLAPSMIRLHERFGVAVPIAMVVASFIADGFRFAGGLITAGWLNGALIALVPHQLGFFYADGALTRLPRRAHAAMAGSGLIALALLTNPWLFGSVGDRWFPGIGHYPRSLVGTDGESITNIAPPTVALLVSGFWSIGAAMLLRATVTRWLLRSRPWRAVIGVNAVIMTLFLWHMTALLVSVLMLWPLDLGRGAGMSARFWLEKPLWIAVSACVLMVIVAAFARFERPRLPARGPSPAWRVARLAGPSTSLGVHASRVFSRGHRDGR